VCVTENKNDYKQIAVIPEELIDKPEIIESLKIVEEANKKLVNWVSVIKKQKSLVGGFRMIERKQTENMTTRCCDTKKTKNRLWKKKHLESERTFFFSSISM